MPLEFKVNFHHLNITSKLKKLKWCVTYIERVERMLCPKTGTTQYHEQLRLPDKGNVIKELVVLTLFDQIIIHCISKISFKDTPKCVFHTLEDIQITFFCCYSKED